MFFLFCVEVKSVANLRIFFFFLTRGIVYIIMIMDEMV